MRVPVTFGDLFRAWKVPAQVKLVAITRRELRLSWAGRRIAGIAKRTKTVMVPVTLLVTHLTNQKPCVMR